MSKAEREAFVAGATWHNIPTTTVLEAPAEALRRFPDKVEDNYCFIIEGKNLKVQKVLLDAVRINNSSPGVLREGKIVEKEGD